MRSVTRSTWKRIGIGFLVILMVLALLLAGLLLFGPEPQPIS